MRIFTKMPRWYSSFDDELAVITPWFAFVVAHEAYHLRMHGLWNGFAFFWGRSLDKSRFLHWKEVVFAYPRLF
jgi:hypothetical protein